MSDKIIIKSILLENYRQYYGEVKIDFSSRDEGFTIIAGKNGEGKSNLLNAISWCLYHEEPHGMADGSNHEENRSLPVINSRYITELPEEKIGKTSVKIWIEKGDTTYSISRILTVLKHKLEFQELENGKSVLKITQNRADDAVPQGCEILPEQGGFVIKEKLANDVDFKDTVKEVSPKVLMDEILPKRLSKYFLLDGEFLEDFWKIRSTIKNAIEQISQLHLLSNLCDHANEMCKMPKGTNKDVNSISTRISNLENEEKSNDEHGNEKFSTELRWNSDEYYHSTGKPLERELDKDCENMSQAISELSKKIGGSGKINIEHLKKEKIQLEEAIEKAHTEYKEYENTYRYNLITKSPYIYLNNVWVSRLKLAQRHMGLTPFVASKQVGSITWQYAQ